MEKEGEIFRDGKRIQLGGKYERKWGRLRLKR